MASEVLSGPWGMHSSLSPLAPLKAQGPSEYFQYNITTCLPKTRTDCSMYGDACFIKDALEIPNVKERWDEI